MVYTIRLIILWVHLKEKWVTDERDYYNILAKYFDGVSFNIIEFQGRIYEGKMCLNLPNMKRIQGYWPIGTNRSRIHPNLRMDGTKLRL